MSPVDEQETGSTCVVPTDGGYAQTSTSKAKFRTFARQATSLTEENLDDIMQRTQQAHGAASDDLMVAAVLKALRPTTVAAHTREGMGWLTGKRADTKKSPSKTATPRRASNLPLGFEPPQRAQQEEMPMAGTVMNIDATGDGPSKVRFKDEVINVSEDVGYAKITLVRVDGDCSGEASIRCYTSADRTAVEGKDYTKMDEVVVFAPGEREAVAKVQILDDDKGGEGVESFALAIDTPTGNCVLDDDGKRAIVRIHDDDHVGRRGKLMLRLGYNADKWATVKEEWYEQFVDAVSVPRDVDGDGKPPGPSEYAVHAIAVVWKVTAALIPPVRVAGGWAAFCVALMLIGLVTMFIGELATFFGCCISCPPGITAITFVAVGTSLPDTFASKAAALADDDADASIGNVTGSNCVNVFLGIGMPWLLCAVYWAISGPTPEWTKRYGALYPEYAEKGAFIVPAGDLGLSVALFSGEAVAAIAVLYMRRKFFGGELGGPFTARIATLVLFVSFWGIYVLISSLKIERYI